MNVLVTLIKNTLITFVPSFACFTSLHATPSSHLISTQLDLVGSVFNDKDGDGYQDVNEEGITGIRLATMTGLIIITGSNGRYSVPNAIGETQNWGNNIILKLDRASLPLGSSLTTENPRIIRFANTGLSKVNFGVLLP